MEPLRERDKWDKYREQIRRAEETLDRALKFHEKNPEKHPSYPDEWKKFWNRRYKELQAEGKDPSKHDFKPEWIEFWNKRMREIHSDQLQQRKEEIRKRLELSEEKPPEKWIPPSSRRERSPPSKRSRHRIESDDEVEYVGTKTIKTDYYDRHDPRERDYVYSSYSRGKSNMYRSYYSRIAPRTRPIHYATPYPVKDKSPTPPQKEEVLSEDLEVVGLLRLLTALEGQLGSLGPKIVSLLSRALAAEKAKPNSAEELLYDEEVSVLFETVKEKLKGQLFAGMIEKMAIAPTKTAIQNIAQLLHKATESKKKMEEEKKKKNELLEASRTSNFVSGRTIYPRPIEMVTPPINSEPVTVPGVGTVDKVAIAQQIAAALVAQGRSNVSQEELETLINAVVGMAEASKHSDKPVTTADFVKGLASGGTGVTGSVSSGGITTGITGTFQSSTSTSTSTLVTSTLTDTMDQVSRMENLSDTDLKTLLQNFKDLTTHEQHGLINFLKKLEATDLPRVEKLRAFVNLSVVVPSSISLSKKSPTPELIEMSTSKTNRKASPFSIRKGNQNPSDEENKWVPKLDMFANDDEEEQQQQKKDDDKSKVKLELSDDDDDYTFEDIYKAADKNVNESEKAKKRTRAFSKSISNSPRSWSRSRSRSRSRSPATRTSEIAKSNDPNAILNETKRLIANIMGDLPNKYVPKSHINFTNENSEQRSSGPKMMDHTSSSITPMQNFYNQNYDAATNQPPRPQAPPLTYPNAPNQQFPNYPPQPQVFGTNQNYIDNGYNYQGYGNMSNQNQYGPSSVPQNQYSPQQGYGASTGYGGPPSSHPSGYPQQQSPQQPQQPYGTYAQQQRFY